MSGWNITLTSNFAAVAEALPEVLSRQIGYAAKRTVNDIAFEIKETVDTEMESVFHKPTPWTMKAINVLKDLSDVRQIAVGSGPAKVAQRQNYFAYVGLQQDFVADDIAPLLSKGGNRKAFWGNRYERALAHQFGQGMVRRYKDMEGLLLKKGLIKPGYYVVPASGCPLDQYDNPVRGFIIQMLTYFEAMRDVGVRSNMNDKSRKRFEKRLAKKTGLASTSFFIVGSPNAGEPVGKAERNHLKPGIWQKITNADGSRKIIPIFLFFKASSYQRRIDFASLAKSTFQTRGSDIFTRHLLRAASNDRISKNLSKYV